MKIDAFCHVMPREYAERLERVDDAPAAANIRNRIAGIPSMVDLDLRFSQMDEFGDDYRQVISLPAPPIEDLGPPPRGREFAKLGNEGLARLVAEHPDRFAGFVAQLPMNDPEGTLEAIDHACGDLGALGVQIYTHVNGHPLDEERFEPFWARMAELGKPVWVHPSRNAGWADYPTEEVSKYEIWWVFGWEYDTAAFMARIVFSGVLERHPDLKILIHHGGSMVPHFAGRVGPGWDQLGARTPPENAHEVEHAPLSKRPLDYFKMFYADTAMFGAAHAIQCCIEFFGVDRILFASDTPFDPEKGPGYIRSTIENLESLDLSDEDRRKIYEGNARRLLGGDVSAAYVYDAIRTPFGRHGGALAGVRPDDLAAHVVRELLARSPDLDPERIGDVLFGDANGAGEDNRNVARMAVLLAGLPTSVPGATVNRLCGSSLDAAMQASRAVETGDASVVLVGGVESMSRAPWVLLKPERGYARTSQELYSTTLGWRMVNPDMPEQWTISLGQSAEKLATIHGISREAQDEFAARSHRLAAAAWDDGRYAGWVVPVPGVELARDEGIRPDSSPEKLATLKPAFAKDGTVTAGNASPLNDGAAALLIGDEAAGAAIGREPLARIAGRGSAGVDPDVFGIAPVEAANRALERAGIGWDDIVVAELNEAFASQTLACLQGWPELDPETLNVNGGAIAIGHPLGASGARILGTLAHELRRRGGGYGVASICIGVGQGLAVVLEA